MKKYKLFSGSSSDNAAYEFMAISEEELKDNPPKDYFLPAFTNIEYVGEILITGDFHYLSDYFSVK